MIYSLEEIKDKLKDRKISMVADSIGISRQALHNIVKGKMNPSYENLLKLSNYMEENK